MFFKLHGYNRPNYKGKYPLALTAIRDVRRASTIHFTWVDPAAWYETRNPSLCGIIDPKSLVHIEDKGRGIEVFDDSNGHRRPYIVPLSFVQGLLCKICVKKFEELTGLNVHETLERAIEHHLYEDKRMDAFMDVCEQNTGIRALAYRDPYLAARGANVVYRFRHRNFRPGDGY